MPRLPKRERLTAQREITALFQKKEATFLFPFRVVWSELTQVQTGDPAVSVLMSVSKKRFKHAVDRNRMKRLMRESYRLHKELLVLPPGKHYAVAFMYVAPDLKEFAYVERKMVDLLMKLSQEIIQHEEPIEPIL